MMTDETCSNLPTNRRRSTEDQSSNLLNAGPSIGFTNHSLFISASETVSTLPGKRHSPLLTIWEPTYDARTCLYNSFNFASETVFEPAYKRGSTLPEQRYSTLLMIRCFEPAYKRFNSA